MQAVSALMEYNLLILIIGIPATLPGSPNMSNIRLFLQVAGLAIPPPVFT
jgi:hypothetical protein